MAFAEPISTKLTLTQHLLVKNFYVEFHKNPTDGLVAENTSHRETEGRTDVIFTSGAHFTVQRTTKGEN
jgi:hypothetical protein